MTAVGCRPKRELCFLPGQLRWTFLPKERYGNLLSTYLQRSRPKVKCL